jgi:type IV secretory pathway VirB10-like protein
MPTASLDDLALTALRDLTHAINNPSSASALSQFINNNHAALLQLAQIFLGTATATETVTIPPATTAMPPAPATAPRVPTAPVPPETSAALPRVESTPTPAMPPPKAVTFARDDAVPTITYADVTQNPGQRRRQKARKAAQLKKLEAQLPNSVHRSTLPTTTNTAPDPNLVSTVPSTKHQAHAIVTMVQKLWGDNSRKFSETSLGFSGLVAIYFM